MLKIKVLLILAVTFLTGCSALGLPSDNASKKKVVNEIYSTAIGNQGNLGSYSIRVPQASDDYNFMYMDMKEIVGTDYTYASFGPGVFDEAIFRVMVGTRDKASFEKYKMASLPVLEDMITSSYGQPIKKIYQINTQFNGRPAIFTVYTQAFPDDDFTLTHAIYIINYGRFTVMLWAMGSDRLGSEFKTSISSKNRYKMINRTWKPESIFFNSFHLNSP